MYSLYTTTINLFVTLSLEDLHQTHNICFLAIPSLLNLPSSSSSNVFYLSVHIHPDNFPLFGSPLCILIH